MADGPRHLPEAAATAAVTADDMMMDMDSGRLQPPQAQHEAAPQALQATLQAQGGETADLLRAGVAKEEEPLLRLHDPEECRGSQSSMQEPATDTTAVKKKQRRVEPYNCAGAAASHDAAVSHAAAPSQTLFDLVKDFLPSEDEMTEPITVSLPKGIDSESADIAMQLGTAMLRGWFITADALATTRHDLQLDARAILTFMINEGPSPWPGSNAPWTAQTTSQTAEGTGAAGRGVVPGSGAVAAAGAPDPTRELCDMLSISKDQAEGLLRQHGGVERCIAAYFDGAAAAQSGGGAAAAASAPAPPRSATVTESDEWLADSESSLHGDADRNAPAAAASAAAAAAPARAQSGGASGGLGLAVFIAGEDREDEPDGLDGPERATLCDCFSRP
jgi:hypothetical protein